MEYIKADKTVFREYIYKFLRGEIESFDFCSSFEHDNDTFAVGQSMGVLSEHDLTGWYGVGTHRIGDGDYVFCYYYGGGFLLHAEQGYDDDITQLVDDLFACVDICGYVYIEVEKG